jgi:hypothetical protein
MVATRLLASRRVFRACPLRNIGTAGFLRVPLVIYWPQMLATESLLLVLFQCKGGHGVAEVSRPLCEWTTSTMLHVTTTRVWLVVAALTQPWQCRIQLDALQLEVQGDC